ncbi:hypothetical protein DFH11DRAFT_1850319 [Phellopilus nigrolimitatus]|nr:hypothetical protein DFH11DRAFT_1850319 [Phellopilus nigrolimitatus]
MRASASTAYLRHTAGRPVNFTSIRCAGGRRMSDYKPPASSTPEPPDASDSNPPEKRGQEVDYSASTQLLADAAREQADEAAQAAAAARALARAEAAAGEANWSGEEPLRAAVLRMLADAHKPLRGPAVRSADEKLRGAPPAVAAPAPGAGWAAVPLLPAVEGHRPWLTTFRPPAHGAPSIRRGAVVAPARAAGAGDAERKVEREARRRGEAAERLGRARDSTLNYRLGVGAKSAEGAQRRPVPLGMKGWASLVEERIERARQEGQFKTLKGRGKPLARETAEGNPFIAREEFLMNRIVQRNRAAPPWVELQAELDSAVDTFRAGLRAAWTRRAVRTLAAGRSAEWLAELTPAAAGALRDAEWATHERAYHEAALGEVNALVRRYNGAAPYAVRRAPLAREAELARACAESAEDVVRGVRERLAGAARPGVGAVGTGQEEDEEGRGGGQGGAGTSEDGGIGVWKVVRGWFGKLRA